MKTDTLYYYDTKGKVRVWSAETEGNKYRVTSGLQDGKKVITKWKTAHAKNTGKKNATTDEEQAIAEVKALFTKQKKTGASETIEGIHNPYIEPMLADKMSKKTKIDFNKPVWVQPKLDGFRCVITRDSMKSRSGEEFINCQHIHESLLPAFTDDIEAFDGELYNHEFHDNFNKLSSLIRKETVTLDELAEIENKVQFHCYDMVPTKQLDFKQRMGVLLEHLPLVNPIYFVRTSSVNSMEDVDQCKHNYVHSGYEGAIIRLNGLYEHKRSKNLIKYKRLEDAEFEIVSIKEGKGNWSGVAKSVEIRLPNGETCFSGMRGTEEFAKKILEEAEFWIGKKVTVEFDGYTPDGALRFPVVTKWHDGKLEKR